VHFIDRRARIRRRFGGQLLVIAASGLLAPASAQQVPRNGTPASPADSITLRVSANFAGDHSSALARR